jgi:hypothetical protein
MQLFMCSWSSDGIEIKYCFPLLFDIYFLHFCVLQAKKHDLFIFAIDVVKLPSFIFSIDGAYINEYIYAIVKTLNINIILVKLYFVFIIIFIIYIIELLFYSFVEI